MVGHLSPEQIAVLADQYERSYGLPAGYLQHTLALESSGGRDRRTSSAGASSIAQIMPATARQYGFDPAVLRQDDEQAIRAAATISQDNARHFGNDPVVLGIAYNAGPARAREYLQTHNLAALPAETQHYIAGFQTRQEPWMRAPIAPMRPTPYNAAIAPSMSDYGAAYGGRQPERPISTWARSTNAHPADYATLNTPSADGGYDWSAARAAPAPAVDASALYSPGSPGGYGGPVSSFLRNAFHPDNWNAPNAYTAAVSPVRTNNG